MLAGQKLQFYPAVSNQIHNYQGWQLFRTKLWHIWDTLGLPINSISKHFQRIFLGSMLLLFMPLFVNFWAHCQVISRQCHATLLLFLCYCWLVMVIFYPIFRSESSSRTCSGKKNGRKNFRIAYIYSCGIR